LLAVFYYYLAIFYEDLLSLYNILYKYVLIVHFRWVNWNGRGNLSMHLCLSCNQPCNLSSIFCESCRLALLERRTEEKPDELPQMVNAGSGDGLVNLVSLPLLPHIQQEDISEITTQTEVGRGLSVQQVEDENWSWSTAGLYQAEKSKEETKEETIVHQAGVALLAPPVPSIRQKMPRRVRRALMVFAVVGILALSIDGVLLAFSIMRHHTPASTGKNVVAEQGTISKSTGAGFTPIPGDAMTPNAISSQPTLNTAFTLSTSRLLFTLSQGQANPPAQVVRLNVGGGSAFAWQILSTAGLPSWLRLSSLQGSAPAGGSAQLAVGVLAGDVGPGTYTASVPINVDNGQGQTFADSPQTLTVTLSVLIPCSLEVTPGALSFNANLLQPAPQAQKLTLTHNGDCSLPIKWSISADASWVTFTTTSGVDTGGGSTITVSVSNPGKLVGTAKSTLTLQAVDADNTPLAVSPSTVTVTLTVIM
jgi:hypothetical protein